VEDGAEDGIEHDLVRRIVRFEEGTDHGQLAWLGGPKGFALGLALLGLAAVVAVLAVVFAFAVDSPTLTKLALAVVLLILSAAGAYWKRQRMAAHFDRAHRMIESADPGERQRGFTEMIINARRGRSEHGRIADTLATYLRRPPHGAPDESVRRQLALSLLADYTLSPAAKEKIDLSGASLAGLRAIDAELPGVCLRGADLGNVRFVRANLAHADFEGARIEGADFTGARLEGTILAGTAPPRRQ
jgi:hypothetical protein